MHQTNFSRGNDLAPGELHGDVTDCPVMKFALLTLAAFLLASPCVAQVSPVAAALPDTYTLGAGDNLRIMVFNEPELSGDQTIAANGHVSLPLIGDVDATGLSSSELARVLQTRFREGYLRNPNIAVTVVSYRPFYVTGEVNEPGAFPYTSQMTVASAVATAGGVTRRANRSHVYLRRAGETTETRVSSRADTALGPGDTVRVAEGMLAMLQDLPLGLIFR